jgi:DNA repair exonuclease SbcCD ATPase subunit
MSKEKGLKIIRLEAENVKKLKAIEIIPKDSTIVISGRNEMGKSSILDSIWLALGGKAASKDLKKPIRDGEEKAHVTVDLGDIIVTRKWTSDTKSYLTIENRDGATFKSPQAILDELIGNLSFDPLAFSHMSDKEQKEILLDLVDIELDLDEWEKDRTEAYEERTGVNRKVKDLEGQLSGLPEPEEGAPTKEVSAADIMTEITKAQEVKVANDDKRKDLTEQRQELAGLEETLAEVVAGIDTLTNRLTEGEKKKEQIQADMKEAKGHLLKTNSVVTALVDPDMEAFQEKLKNVEDVNKVFRENQKRVDTQKSLYTAKRESQDLTDELDGMDKTKSDAIEKAEFPIEHLGFDETGVTYKDIPFGQCSAAETLRVSLSIAMAINPKLRVLRIMDGSLLDSANMKIIQDMVKEHDFQVWVEIVDESGKMGIYIEDGEVKGAK